MMKSRAGRRFGALCLLVSAFAGISAGPEINAAPAGAPPEGFASPQIAALWQRDDGPVAAGKVNRSWLWGPGAFFTTYEPFAGTPSGNHLVQYFDKGRLEVNDPGADPASPWFVTSGLLVKELVTGMAEVGGGRTLDIGPARVAVVGDDPAASPTYADFALPTVSDRQPDLTGRAVGCFYTPSRVLPAELNRPLSRFEQASGHNWAEPFWQYATGTLGERWLQVLGYPLTDPCAVQTSIAGKPTTVLVQLFERRVLTYNPNNPPSSRVEMGNVGRAYYRWRYEEPRRASLSAAYSVQVQVGAKPKRATQVVQEITFTNTTGGPLPSVVLRAVWHHWDGVFNPRSATVNGQRATTRWVYGINLELMPPSPIPPGAMATVRLEYGTNPRPVGGRTGYDTTNDILSLGDMLPTLVPWEQGGWLYYPYSDLGDFGYYDSARYEVTVASASGERLVVGGTGDIVGTSDSKTSWTFRAENVRDAAYIVSPRFIDPTTDAGMTRQVGNTKMLAYFLTQHKAAGQKQLELTAPALRWFGERIGAYPFASYTVAEMGVPLERTDNYAQEYPAAYFIPSQWLAYGTSAGSWTWYTPVHEVGHQWFYSTVGNNQLADAWLDEALTTYITAEYVRANYPSHYGTVWADMTKNATRAMPVSGSVFSGFKSEAQYSATIYDSGALMLDRVRRAMGDTAFYAGLRDYYSAFRYAVARPVDFVEALQRHTSADLSGIFGEYLAR